MRTMPRLTSLAALAALTISSSVAAAGPEPVSLVTRDLDWVTAGSAEALRALTDDSGRVDVGTLPGRTGVVQPDRQVAPVDTPQFGVPGTAVLSSLVSGINGSDGLAGPLGNDAAIGVLLSLRAGVVDRPPVIGIPGGGVPVLEPGSGGGF